MIFECGPQGADRKVCEVFVKKLNPDTQIEPITLNNKPNLIAQCGTFAAELLKEDKCDRVVIVWDLYPAWREAGQKPCRKEDREAILKSLAEASVPLDKAFLVCITEELEAWLLADRRALVTMFPRLKPDKIKDYKDPESVQNPKKVLNNLFQEARMGRYTDYQHAARLAGHIPDLSRLKRCSSFVRFALKVTDQQL